MAISLTEILLIIAAAQGFFLTLFLLQKYVRVYAARFVSLLIFLYSITVLAMVVNDLGYSVQIQELYAVFLAIPFSIGPLHYFFALFLTQPNRRFRKKDALHFAPFLFALFLLPIFVFFSNITFVAGRTTLTGVVPAHFIIFNWVIFIYATVYSLLALFNLRQHARKIRNIFSSVDKVQLKWLLNITYLVLFVIAVFCIENILMSFGINVTNYYTVSSIMMAVYVYTLGYMSILHMDVFLDPSVRLSIQQTPEPDRQKYQKSGLSDEKAKEYLERLIDFMRSDKPFHDNNLTLNQLAEKVNLTPHNLSEVLNTQLGQNFFDFINSYRVEEVKAALSDADKQHLTLLAIAFDAGFNSKTAFNTIFKKFTGRTPSEYRQSV